MRITTAGVASCLGRYLAALRSPGSSIGSAWEFPGGKVDAGESPKEALAREFREELTVDVTVGDLIAKLQFSNGEEEYELHAYQVEIPVTVYQLNEHQQTSWLTLRELLELPMASSDRALMDRLLECRS